MVHAPGPCLLHADRLGAMKSVHRCVFERRAALTTRFNADLPAQQTADTESSRSHGAEQGCDIGSCPCRSISLSVLPRILDGFYTAA